MIRLAHYKHPRGGEYIVIITDDGTTPETHREPGYSLVAVVEVKPVSDGYVYELNMMPTDRPLYSDQ